MSPNQKQNVVSCSNKENVSNIFTYSFFILFTHTTLCSCIFARARSVWWLWHTCVKESVMPLEACTRACVSAVLQVESSKRSPNAFLFKMNASKHYQLFVFLKFIECIFLFCAKWDFLHSPQRAAIGTYMHIWFKKLHAPVNFSVLAFGKWPDISVMEFIVFGTCTLVNCGTTLTASDKDKPQLLLE